MLKLYNIEKTLFLGSGYALAVQVVSCSGHVLAVVTEAGTHRNKGTYNGIWDNFTLMHPCTHAHACMHKHSDPAPPASHLPTSTHTHTYTISLKNQM